MVFGTYATGYKSGGFNSGSGMAPLNAATRTFDSETVKDVEVGVKSKFWDGKFLLNATLFDTTLYNYQDRSFNGVGFVVRNAGDVKSKGVDLDAQVRVLAGLNVSFAATYLDSIYAKNLAAPGLEGCTGAAGCPTVQNLSGKTVTYAPKWHGNFGVHWNSRPLFSGYTAAVAASESYTASFATSATLNPQSVVPSYSTTDLRISLTSSDERWQFDLFGTNIFDKHYYTSTNAQVLAQAMGVNSTVTGATLFRGLLGDPARFGLRVTAKF
jgi:iron complex outermembrane receptor protein